MQPLLTNVEKFLEMSLRDNDCRIDIAEALDRIAGIKDQFKKLMRSVTDDELCEIIIAYGAMLDEMITHCGDTPRELQGWRHRVKRLKSA